LGLLVGKSQVFAEVNIISQKSLHFPSQKMCSLMSVLDNFSISKNNIICAEATQGTMVSKLSVNVKPLHTYTTQFIKLALSSVIF
jgi:hypothetical protein